MKRPERMYVRKCAESSCTETCFYRYRSSADYLEVVETARNWRCQRHDKPEELLTPSRPRLETILTVGALKDAPGLYWQERRSGFTHGPGFKMFAEDFPVATKVRISVEVLAEAHEEPTP